MLGELERLPEPQRQALATVFGLSAGPAPDRFMVGLATLTLMGELAEQQPLVCVVDDAQWLDQASEQILSFVAHRLLAEPIALVCAARTGIGDHVLAGLPEVPIGGLGDRDSRALLLGHTPGPLDAAVYGQLIAESHGNPLALLELARVANVATVAGGFTEPASQGVGHRIEQSYAQRLDALPAQTRLLVLAAAAEPLGDLALLERTGEILGIEMAALAPAIDAHLMNLGPWVEFAHPLVRSAAYRTASPDGSTSCPWSARRGHRSREGPRSACLASRPCHGRSGRRRRRRARAVGGASASPWRRRCSRRVSPTRGRAHAEQRAAGDEGAHRRAAELPGWRVRRSTRGGGHGGRRAAR